MQLVLSISSSSVFKCFVCFRGCGFLSDAISVHEHHDNLLHLTPALIQCDFWVVAFHFNLSACLRPRLLYCDWWSRGHASLLFPLHTVHCYSCIIKNEQFSPFRWMPQFCGKTVCVLKCTILCVCVIAESPGRPFTLFTLPDVYNTTTLLLSDDEETLFVGARDTVLSLKISEAGSLQLNKKVCVCVCVHRLTDHARRPQGDSVKWLRYHHWSLLLCLKLRSLSLSRQHRDSRVLRVLFWTNLKVESFLETAVL